MVTTRSKRKFVFGLRPDRLLDNNRMNSQFMEQVVSAVNVIKLYYFAIKI
ncbi:MAG: hypothetical protein RML10_05435 [Geminocystis sp.]|nr:hypothetical protein [Geminocystis sp.]MCX8077188.1 hypothetical protein [Geminocystis sp.]MDW8463030.1 hypothetical protein [Geminocystis sp.]